ncbi:MAG: DEAD/DEAH box helicase family protein [Pelotomaculum sp.]|uniref:3'-5' exonuclease DinG n=1 Tax=Pelotomaculum thermopropionicum (strain DSM 13744 / JCM 10971 / SI) TaxID=370438 RepID=A5D2F3_PELTS|nr:DEAD/DEAH box helicase family protein [Pelotomaculum sp.]BAF59595.1 hypothetical protein PTH_1414 [Pelotomaculum thermopropionicum SI]
MIKEIVVCDLETTGLDPLSDRIIEIGLVRLKDLKIVDIYHTMVNPGRPLPLKIKNLTGLDDSDLASAPAFSGVREKVLGFIGDAPIAGHNIRFDMGFLAAAGGISFKNPAYDTVELARLAVPGLPTYRLESLCERLNVEAAARHRALDDALAAAGLLIKLIHKLHDIDIEVLAQLNALLTEARSEWQFITTSLLKSIIKKFPDRKIPESPYWKRLPDKKESTPLNALEPSAKREKVLLAEDEVAVLVGKDGPLADVVPGYEYRPQQQEMIRLVTRALNEEKYLLMEAGTGVGKSLAYLIPSVLWSCLNRQRVLVATRTINLQEQLWHKDIPLAAKVTGRPFKASLVKGRQNYICLRRWFSVLENPHQPQEAGFFARVLTWLTVTQTGDKSELNVIPAEEDFWLSICGESDGCMGSRCRYLKYCFVNAAKREAEESNLIITNHSLLFSDVKVENRILPAYEALIIDEAHHLEESATVHLGRQVTQGALNRWLSAAGKALFRLAEKVPPEDVEKWSETIKDSREVLLEAQGNVHFFFQQLGELASALSNDEGDSGRITLRLSNEKMLANTSYNAVLECGTRCIELFLSLNGKIGYIAKVLEMWGITEEVWAEAARDLFQIYNSGQTIIDDLQFILEGREQGFVYWAEFEYSRRGFKNYALYAAPVNVGTVLYEQFFKNRGTVIFSSATISVNGTFDHFIDRNGLNNFPPEKIIKASFDSPFAFERQALLCICHDLPVQGAVAEEVYLDNLEEAILKLLEAVGGRTLVLFTSHKVLRETYRRLKPRMEARGICILGHGIDGNRLNLLEEFKSTAQTVLFGASSFWEGVDVPGEALSCVIMVKLPFVSPSVPVIEARLEDLARRKRDGFRDLSVPQAVIRFKQGFGRLIRSGSDRGCVIVLDRRILSRSYGRRFLNSLPLKKHFRGDIETIVRKISDWMKE